jgi:adenylate cyclase
MQAGEVLFFDRFRLDHRGLFRLDETVGEQPIILGSRARDLLVLLAQRSGETVSRDEIMRTVWPDVAVEEANLTVQISALRRILGVGEVRGGCIQTIPGRGYRFTAAVTRSSAVTPALALPTKPSIAVLPFTNLSNDPGQEYFSDGVVQEITTALSRVRWLFVIARNSSFTYKGKAVDVRQVGRELGVRYVLDGSMRKFGSRVRISAELLDAATGVHVWADRYDRDIVDIFALQDEIAGAVVGAVVPNLRMAEIDRATRQRPGSLSAYDLYLRALPGYYSVTREGYFEAVRLLRQALELDPGYAAAAALIAACIGYGIPWGWGGSAAEAVRLARRSIELDNNDAEALAICGYTLAFQNGEFHEAIGLVERAITLDPNSAFCLIQSGWVHLLADHPANAIDSLERALRLSPLDPLKSSILGGSAHCYIQLDRGEEAIVASAQAVSLSPNNSSAWRAVTASLVLASRADDARAAAQQVLRIEPNFTLTGWNRRTGAAPRMMRRLTELLKEAGLPE